MQLAEHMLISTYPLVKDQRLLLGIAGDIFSALSSGIEAFMLNKKKAGGNDFDSLFESFRGCAKGINDDEFNLVVSINNIVKQHKASPVEFARKEKYVICDENYNCSEISPQSMKNYLFRARLFIEKLDKMLRE